MKEGYCKNCGQYFRRNRGSRDASLFCSRECAYEYHTKQAQERRKQKEAAKVRLVTCPICGTEFYTKLGYVRFCSKECALEAGRTRARERRRRLYPVNFKPQKVLCRWCGKEFETEYKQSKVFCCEECRNAHMKEKLRIRNRIRAHNSNRRLRGKVVDRDITLDRLIKRDKGRCKICGGLVDRKDFTMVNNHMKCGSRYPTIDHIIPLSQGGLHSWANVQLAHFLCNSYKGDSFLVSENVCVL